MVLKLHQQLLDQDKKTGANRGHGCIRLRDQVLHRGFGGIFKALPRWLNYRCI